VECCAGHTYSGTFVDNHALNDTVADNHYIGIMALAHHFPCCTGCIGASPIPTKKLTKHL
uniref:Uncharacterized protein n=1 Tax=Romanomermis culicivorax TaxID=13658 RepID=A0A915HRF5_ROMCU